MNFHERGNRRKRKKRKKITWLCITCLVLLSDARGFWQNVLDALVRLSISHCWASNTWYMISIVLLRMHVCVCVIVANYSLFIPHCTYAMDHHWVISVFSGNTSRYHPFHFSVVFFFKITCQHGVRSKQWAAMYQ